MFRSYTMFRAFGIPIRIHGTMLVFLPVLALMSGQPLLSLLLLIGVFGSVLLHELGHALAARYYKVPVRQITLYPIGGVAGLTNMPDSPKKELVITAAGPLVNFILAPIFGALWLAFGGAAGGLAAVLMQYLAIANIVLGTFNLLPGFPMDGGRILRALLATRMPHLRATQIAVRVGQMTAIAIGLFGLWQLRLMLIVLAAFIYFAAKAELMGAMMRAAQQSGSPAMGSVLGQLFGAVAASRQESPRQGSQGAAQPTQTPREGETFVINPDAQRRPPGDPPGDPRVIVEIRPDGTVRRRP